MVRDSNIPNINIPIIYRTTDAAFDQDDDRFTLILLKEGNAIVTIDKKRYYVGAPSMICMNDNENIVVEQSSKLIAESLSFVPSFISSSFTPNMLASGHELRLVSNDMDLFWLNAFIKHNELFSGIIKLGPETLIKVATSFANIHKEITNRDNKYWPCRTRGLFMELLFFIENQKNNSEQSTDLILSPNIDKDVEQIILHINSYYENPLKIEDLCKTFSMNRTTLSDKFKKSLGMTVGQYINKVRIQMACKLLSETYLSVLEIMHNTGFSTTANFNKSFKKQTGQTPRDYRDTNRV